MTDTNSERRLTRRNALRIAGAAGAASLAGCGGSDGGDGAGGTGTNDSSGDGGATQTQALEVAHWWGEGDGLDAIQEMMNAFTEKHPNIEFDENLVAGGAGTNLQSNIRTRIQNGNHPSTWQQWPGAALQPYTEANLLKDIGDSVWSENAMKENYLPGPKTAAKPAGNFVTVPLNIHRLNNVFYNTAVIEDAGVDPSSIEAPSDLTDALQAVSDAGYTGMAHQTNSPWSTTQLFETVYLGLTDAETYAATFEEGDIDANSDTLTQALNIVREYSQFYPSDAGSISWTEANNGVINGQAGFIHQGDWAAGTYITNDLEYGEEWDYIVFPGTSGLYSLVMDSFPYPVDNPSPDATTEWCRYAGTTEAQEIFCPGKGAIPPRKDASTEPFNEFSTDQIDHFQNSDAQPRSLAHGLAAPPAVASGVSSAMSSFISGSSNEEVISELANAYSQ
ncbi:ABC transporter substrate-binding protein [Haloarcula nitratireducens]|uniref:ABC transporter substrate-binding protein n=1 Tax=Haloarcula nitratireducens TaxID=2487749 RepID=A0AAW4PHH9_9EURY|nr:ABC transporter substrate-binding protein [Halomicroarcula nitratireducens]MBX0297444.1 ABC transporter substrate-binding protein [Halomicroarcula nitratireducens]